MAKIQDIYDHYLVPSNLQKHMLWTAGIGDIITKSWQDSQNKIKAQDVITALLVHDLANIVKFDLSFKLATPMDPSRSLNEWRQIQEKFKARYGLKADQANLAAAKELGLSKQIINLLDDHHFKSIPKVIKNQNCGHQITLYADLRIAPTGIVSIKDRVIDLKNRYQAVDADWQDETVFKNRLKNCLNLEQEINQRTKVDITKIKQDELNQIAKNLRSFPIKEEMNLAKLPQFE